MKIKQALNPLALVTASIMVNPWSQPVVNAEQNPFQLEEIEKNSQVGTDTEGDVRRRTLWRRRLRQHDPGYGRHGDE